MGGKYPLGKYKGGKGKIGVVKEANNGGTERQTGQGKRRKDTRARHKEGKTRVKGKRCVERNIEK